jgi:hypothetical protein
MKVNHPHRAKIRRTWRNVLCEAGAERKKKQKGYGDELHDII